jgi:hypothetical protein
MKLCISNSHLSEHTHKSNLRINSNIVTLSSQQVEIQHAAPHILENQTCSFVSKERKRKRKEREKKKKKKKRKRKKKEKEKDR